MMGMIMGIIRIKIIVSKTTRTIIIINTRITINSQAIKTKMIIRLSNLPQVKFNHKQKEVQLKRRSLSKWISQKMMAKKKRNLVQKVEVKLIELEPWQDFLLMINLVKMKDLILVNKVYLIQRLPQLAEEKHWHLNINATTEKWQCVFLDQNKEVKEQMYTRNIILRVPTV